MVRSAPRNGHLEKQIFVRVGAVDSKTAAVIGAVYCWNKLYKRSLKDGIRYPEGRVYEYMAITSKLVYKSSKTVFIPDLLYYYHYRENSISYLIISFCYEFLAGFERYDELKKQVLSRKSRHSVIPCYDKML